MSRDDPAWRLTRTQHRLHGVFDGGRLWVSAGLTSLGSLQIGPIILLLNGRQIEQPARKPDLSACPALCPGSAHHWEWFATDGGYRWRHALSERTVHLEEGVCRVVDQHGRSYEFLASNERVELTEPEPPAQQPQTPAPLPPTEQETRTETASAFAWAQAIEDPSHRQVLLHLEKYGSIDENEIISLLGSGTAFRRFSRSLDSYLPHLPYEVDIDTSGTLKRYRRK